MKGRYQLAFVHKLLISILFIAGVCSLFHPETVVRYAYQRGNFSYLPAGEYEVIINYVDSPEGNRVLLWSDQMLGENNEKHVEYWLQELPEGSGAYVSYVTLEQDTYGLCIGTEMDTAEKCYLSEIKLQMAGLINLDNYFLAGIFLLSAFFVFVIGKTLPVRTYLMPAILIGMGLLSSIPILNEVLPYGDDLGYHLVRIEGLYRGLGGVISQSASIRSRQGDMDICQRPCIRSCFSIP